MTTVNTKHLTEMQELVTQALWAVNEQATSLLTSESGHERPVYHMDGSGLLDSVQLVTLVSTIEEKVSERFNIDIELLDENFGSNPVLLSSIQSIATATCEKVY